MRVTPQMVGKWRSRFVAHRLDGLLDEPRPGAPRKLGDAQVERLITTTLNQRPRDATHWSSRALARKLGVDLAGVDPTGSVVLDYCTAVRGILNDDQGGPLHPPGVIQARIIQQLFSETERSFLHKAAIHHEQSLRGDVGASTRLDCSGGISEIEEVQKAG